jgi:hypothetical protein
MRHFGAFMNTTFLRGERGVYWGLARGCDKKHSQMLTSTYCEKMRKRINSMCRATHYRPVVWGEKPPNWALAPGPSRARLTRIRMADALHRMQSPEMRARAATLREKSRREDGVNSAIPLISESFPLLPRDFPGLESIPLK